MEGETESAADDRVGLYGAEDDGSKEGEASKEGTFNLRNNCQPCERERAVKVEFLQLKDVESAGSMHIVFTTIQDCA